MDYYLKLIFTNSKIRNSADYRRNLLVKAGSPKPGHGDAYSVRSILIHPNFDAKTFDYDVSVVVILGEFNSERNQIAIPLATQKNTDALIGMEAMVTGFGRTAVSLNEYISKQLHNHRLLGTDQWSCDQRNDETLRSHCEQRDLPTCLYTIAQQVLRRLYGG